MIPEAAVGTAAKAQYWNDGLAWDDGTVPDWECEDDSLQEGYLAAARAALEAAAPHMIQAAKAGAWDEGHLMGWSEATANELPERESLWRNPYR